jgi:hypothetical protein
MQQQHRRLLPHAADAALVGVELIDDLGVVISRDVDIVLLSVSQVSTCRG